MQLYACESLFYLVHNCEHMMATGQKITNLAVFVVAENSRLAKCKICGSKVLRGGQNTKLFTITNLIHHLEAHSSPGGQA